MAQPSPFVKKTFEFVSDGSLDDIVSWNESGDSFVVWKPHELQTQILPRYFKHANLCSFIRQLNTYDFRKVSPHNATTEHNETLEFQNPNFRRDKPDLLAFINRKRPGRKSTGLIEPPSLPLPESNPLQHFSEEDISLLSQVCVGGQSEGDKLKLRQMMNDSQSIVHAIASLTSKQEHAEHMLRSVSEELRNARRIITSLAQGREIAAQRRSSAPPRSLPSRDASVATSPSMNPYRGSSCGPPPYSMNGSYGPRNGYEYAYGTQAPHAPSWQPPVESRSHSFSHSSASTLSSPPSREEVDQISQHHRQGTLPLTSPSQEINSPPSSLLPLPPASSIPTIKKEQVDRELSSEALASIVIPSRTEVASLAKEKTQEP